MIAPVLEHQVNRLIDNAPEIAETLRFEWEFFQAEQVRNNVLRAITKGLKIKLTLVISHIMTRTKIIP